MGNFGQRARRQTFAKQNELQPTGGTLKVGFNTKIAYFDQHRTAIDPDSTVREIVAPDGSDVVMPGLNGRELAELVTAMRPDSKVLFMTGYAADFLADEGFLKDETHVIGKPFRPDQLAAKLRELLDAGRGMIWAGDR